MDFVKYTLRKKWYQSIKYKIYDQQEDLVYQIVPDKWYKSNYKIIEGKDQVVFVNPISILRGTFGIDVLGEAKAEIRFKLALKSYFELDIYNYGVIKVFSQKFGKRYIYKFEDEEVALISSLGAMQNKMGIAIRSDLDPLVILGSWVAIKRIRTKQGAG